mmetsp:Transcript_10774/g.14919  ORF Transcript_10774/g.14919 Transcript_10774/m.14919 type:complete len:118 (+) Transcript_10774:136-489(+)|eukprot:CAMPEP_0197291858 /NCGR_PEP_ID=MMETSP0890-20130614/19569_1 /TAXON_ID=44058 ORGANISM="Aureoumbra lagunensis, Strain CCMP1510" /NCGR_SAMPLE_ID=MMETSP0890 /ASSEMBLY_ACC=CAM_ASM_000533 /LENGTH=117 /DNA_ID=CAMNT_0042765297 /DNA_START=104 /DNA_END=457 /DNA_ORIENTATION=+
MALFQEGEDETVIPNDEDRTAKSEIRSLLGCLLRFTLDDKRVIVGIFQCMDSDRNFIVAKAEETRRLPVDYGLDETILEKRTRRLGLVMVPGKHLVRVEAMASDLQDRRIVISSESQ